MRQQMGTLRHRAARRPPRPLRAGLLLLLLLASPHAASAQTDLAGPVVHGRWEGVIGPVTALYVDRLLTRAQADGAQAVLLELDTPGGLDTSMRDVIKDFLATPVPVIVFVYPSGSRAGSAGVFITMAAHVAAMAPGTNIGAAHPVAMGGGEMDSTMTVKVTNDAAAYARSLAARRGRNAVWAEEAVRNSVSATADEAVELEIVDLVAESVPDLLRDIDGRVVGMPGGPVRLHTADAPLVAVPTTLRERLLALLADPNMAYIFMLLGVYGLIFELQNPGAILPGVVGVISLVLAFMSFQTLPVDYAGLALIGLAMVLFILEIKVPSHGVLTVGGVVSMLLGSLMLFDTAEPSMQVSLGLIIFAVLLTALFFAFAVGMGLRAQAMRVATGSEGLIGERGEARSLLDPLGKVAVHGEIWKAESAGGVRIEAGAAIEVVETAGLRLRVRQTAASAFEEEAGGPAT